MMLGFQLMTGLNPAALTEMSPGALPARPAAPSAEFGAHQKEVDSWESFIA